jgi:hypothetical protein
VKYNFYPGPRARVFGLFPRALLNSSPKLKNLTRPSLCLLCLILTPRNPIALSPSRPLSQTLPQSLSPSRPLSQTLSQSLSPSHPSLRLNLSPFRLSLSYDPPKLKSSLFLHRRSSLHQLASSSTITYVHLFIYLFFMLGVRVLAC